MPGGGFAAYGQLSENYEGGVTVFVIFSCAVAALGGLLFGYDLGISGGVTSMDDFLKKFFPSVYQKMVYAFIHNRNQYCLYDNQMLTLFTSSLYLAALVASFFASAITRGYGRKVSMFIGGLAYLAGSILNGTAVNLMMLIFGRIMLGIGVGFSLQAMPVYLTEMAPARLRGALNVGFVQIGANVGMLAANLVNYRTSQIEGGWGWRVSLGLPAVPALLMTIGSIFLPETPNSILERGHREEARRMLKKVRGTENVDQEFRDLVAATDAAKKIKSPMRNILLRKYRPQLVICSIFSFFQQVTGINVIMFYAPVVFRSLGFGDRAALMAAAITGAVNVLGTIVSAFLVDRFGRRALFLEGGIQIVICQIAIGGMIGMRFGMNGQGSFSKGEADLLLFLVCVYVAAFAWSWGPLAWMVPADISPLEVRSAGQAVNVSVNMFFTFISAQAFLALLCHLKFGLFYFFAGFVIIMTTFVFFFVPETKNIPIEEMGSLLKAHWFWGKYVADEDATWDTDERNSSA